MDILLKDKGIIAGCDDLNGKLNALLDTLDNKKEYTLIFDKGEYHLPIETAVRKVLFMTNTVGEREMSIPTRMIGIELNNRNNITLDGNGSSLIYYGRMTEFVITNSKNICIKNFNVDFDKATVAEFKVIKVNGSDITLIPCKDTAYKIINNKIVFDVMEDVECGVVIQECDVENKITHRVSCMTSWSGGNFFAMQSSAIQNSDGSVTMRFPIHKFREGMVYQMCRILRDACGTFIADSDNVQLLNNNYYFMHGMGILAQCVHNLTIDNCNMIPNKDKGRTTAAFADLIHCSTCSGDIIVNGCTFDGSRDDIINVHGNHYKISKVYGSTIEMKYKHSQTYGFNCLRVGDTVEIIHNGYLTPMGQYEVESTEMLDPRTVKITVKGKLAKTVKPGRLLENLTRQPNLTYTNNKAYNIPTRGMLITTHGKVVVANNIFHKMYMSAILVSDDGRSWYESGYVRDITIENNRFEDCLTWVIDILPEAHTLIRKPIVHKNITVKNNYIKVANPHLLRVKRCENFTFEGNTLDGDGSYIMDVKNNVNLIVKL